MDKDNFQIRDECRKNLTRYTIQAFSLIPGIDNPQILDIGCGTGVSSLELIKRCNGVIHAVDPDLLSIERLREQVSMLNLNGRIRIFNDSIYNMEIFKNKFDIVLAEGLLNVIGFEKGLSLLVRHLKENGYLIIHDELKDDSDKRKMLQNFNLKLIDSFVLDENVWWNEYYNCLENKIKKTKQENQFKKEIDEIEGYRKNPLEYRSVFYILQS
jgi:ubiquinone/menaquinone biosynthesis C-methylase UbiE